MLRGGTRLATRLFLHHRFPRPSGWQLVDGRQARPPMTCTASHSAVPVSEAARRAGSSTRLRLALALHRLCLRRHRECPCYWMLRGRRAHARRPQTKQCQRANKGAIAAPGASIARPRRRAHTSARPPPQCTPCRCTPCRCTPCGRRQACRHTHGLRRPVERPASARAAATCGEERRG